MSLSELFKTKSDKAESLRYRTPEEEEEEEEVIMWQIEGEAVILVYSNSQFYLNSRVLINIHACTPKVLTKVQCISYLIKKMQMLFFFIYFGGRAMHSLSLSPLKVSPVLFQLKLGEFEFLRASRSGHTIYSHLPRMKDLFLTQSDIPTASIWTSLSFFYTALGSPCTLWKY